MADPFYLGGPSKSEEAAAVLLEEHEVESIPIFRCAHHRFTAICRLAHTIWNVCVCVCVCVFGISMPVCMGK
jgi:hypothetical protein